MLRIDLNDGDVYTPGDTISGRVVWQPTEPTRYKGLTVVLTWRTEGRGTPHKARVAGLESRDSGEVGADGVSVDFSLDVPVTGPCSYDGSLIRIIWTVDAEVDVPWARDKETVCPVRIVRMRER